MFLICGDAAKFITHNGFRGAISRRFAAKSRLWNSSPFVEKKCPLILFLSALYLKSI